ncbi:MAG: phosphonopyruvate decarboxylase [Alphaproteobacteria bacterium]|jgi:phosphonopyruvate decarboxylase|nr:phosphonopyruvate decarboxylase [Alphaproteobacteria bacterium]
MIQADTLLSAAKARGFDFFTGVPCSFLTPIINRVISDRETSYVGAASEGEAVAIASGAWLAGKETVVMCQNSGLGNTINPLTSLNHPFRIPTLMFVTWRGQPGLGDEPQHELMGEITDVLIRDIGVGCSHLPDEEGDVGPALDVAQAAMRENDLPYAFIVAKGAVADAGLDQAELVAPPMGNYSDLRKGGIRATRYQTLERVVDMAPETAAMIATTGKCGRELFTIADRDQHLYQVGSMGCASAMGLGVALNVDRPVIVLDGDGAALMKMGSFATIGAQAPKNLVHVILDNGVHDSTGGQATVSPIVDFARVALACGYRTGTVIDDLDGFDQSFAAAMASEGPHLVHARIAPGSLSKLGRPTVKPPEVARRFKRFLAS